MVKKQPAPGSVANEKRAAEMPVADAAAWEEAERLYSDKSLKVADIATLVGLSAIGLSNEAKKRDWPLRTAGKTAKPKEETPEDATPKAAKPKSRAKAKPAKVAHKPPDLVQRVYNTINIELTKLEEQVGTTSQDRERASRALSQMVNSLEKAVEMQREITKDKKRGSGAKQKEALAHAEDLRRQIAERLERLNRKRADQTQSE